CDGHGTVEDTVEDRRAEVVKGVEQIDVRGEPLADIPCTGQEGHEGVKLFVDDRLRLERGDDHPPDGEEKEHAENCQSDPLAHAHRHTRRRQRLMMFFWFMYGGAVPHCLLDLFHTVLLSP